MSSRATILFAALALIGLYGPVGADPEREQALERGNAHYLLFCANCHGVNADGRGPLVELLKVVPSDLTTLRQTSQGATVTERVLSAVDGRHQVAADERKMPVFSDNLEIRTVIEIADYLDSIQK